MSKAPEAVTFDVGGAKLTIESRELLHAWLHKHLEFPEGVLLTSNPICPILNDGEHYAGLVFGKDGALDHHLILLPGEIESATWQKAQEWAKAAGGELPNRREQSLLFANLKEQFKEAWYWSSEQHASLSVYAWCQSFSHGYQDDIHKDDELRARAVRRLVIE